MQVKDVMTREVEVINPTDTIENAAAKMRALHVGPLPVCDGAQLQGMVTDRDITVRATAAGKDPATTPVTEVMTPDVLYVFEDQDLQEAARLMEERQVRRLVVLNHDKRLVGVVSLGDLSTETRDTHLSGEVLEGVSEPSQPKR